MLLTHRQARPDSQFPGISFDFVPAFSYRRQKYIPCTPSAATGCGFLNAWNIRDEFRADARVSERAIYAFDVGSLDAPEWMAAGCARQIETMAHYIPAVKMTRRGK